MERRRSLCFEHSDEEDEDQMKRISMCFSIDVSERVRRQNRFHSQVSATERDSRAPGGGLFGNVEDRRPQRSFMSFTVPNKFYADSRDDKYANTRKKSTENRRKSIVPYEYDEGWLRENYETDRRYPRYKKNERYKSRPRTESYNYAMPIKSHKVYNSPRYEEPEERPRRKHYRPRDSYDYKVFREPIPEFVFKKKRERQEKFFEENFDLYNGEFPTKFTHDFKENPTRNAHRKKSGRDYESNYETNPGLDYYNNQPDYYGYKSRPNRRKSVDFFGQDCEIPYNILKRARVNRYPESQTCLRFSSVDIPYRKKRRRRSYDTEPELPQRTESGSDFCRPKKQRCCEKTRGFNPLTRSSQRLWNHHLNRCQGAEVCCTKSRKSLKEKISGFFKRSKCKSRTKCCRYPRGLRRSRSWSRSRSHTCLDNSKSLSSISCAVVQSRRCPVRTTRAKCIAYPTVYRDKCPGGCPDPDDPDQDCDECCSPPKVNCFQFDCGTSKSCCSKSCRQCAASSGSCQTKARLSVEAPSYGSFDTEEPFTLIGRNSCGSLTHRMPRTVCYGAPKVPKCPGIGKICCSTENLAPAVCPGMRPVKCPIRTGSCPSCVAEDRPRQCLSCPPSESSKKPCCSPSISQESLSCAPCGPQADRITRCPSAEKTGCSSPPLSPPPPPSCCCSACVNDLLLNQIKQSTINVSMKICAADGNLMEPAVITARLEPNKPSCPPSTSCLNNSPKTSDTCTVCSENNYLSVRAVNQLTTRNTSNTSCTAQKALKPILSTARKKRSSPCCTPYKEKSRETIDWDKCPSLRCCPEKGRKKSCKKKASSCQCCRINAVEEEVTNPCSENAENCSITENCSDSSKLQLCTTNSVIPCKKSSAKVEFACCPSPSPPCPPAPPLECPAQCGDRPSFLEELKRELLERLRSEQQLDCQLPYQQPTPHISIFSCAQEDTCPIVPNQRQSSPHPNPNLTPCSTCWSPL